MGPYWAIGCMAELYRFVAVVGVLAALVLIPFTGGMSLIGLPIVFGYIVAARFFRLMIDLAHSSRGTYEILKSRSGGGVRVPPAPGGVWDEDEKLKRRDEVAFRRQKAADRSDRSAITPHRFDAYATLRKVKS